jgi:hypothetical protein
MLELQNATSADLVSYLSGTVPDENDADCITWALKRLGAERYVPAIPVLAKLLDFRRPPNEFEKKGISIHPSGTSDLYPAAGALELIGEKVLPTMLDVIKSESMSKTARDNAVAVLMEIHKYKKRRELLF